jgi:hypothetical protein
MRKKMYICSKIGKNMTATTVQTPMNGTQMMLLRLFSQPIPEERMKEIKKLLLDYYTSKLHEEVEKAVAEKGISDADIDAVLNKQQRTK